MADTSYFFERVDQDVKDKTRVGIDSAKNALSEQRRVFRNTVGKNEFLATIHTAHFPNIYQNIAIEIKKMKEKNKKTKEESHNQKNTKHKTRRESEKIINEIFKLRQEMSHKKMNLERLHNEQTALTNKQRKKMDISNTKNEKYSITSLMDTMQCKSIINAQTQLLNGSNEDLNAQKTKIVQHKSINNELNKKQSAINAQIQSLKDMISVQNGTNNNLNNLQSLEKELESLKRLLNISRFEIQNHKLCIEYKSISNEFYKIWIEIVNMHRKNNKIYFEMKSIEIINGNGTRFSDISQFIMAKYCSNANENGLVPLPVVVIKRVIIEILLCLRKLNERYVSINKLFEIYGNNKGMLPWLPENGQLVFKFTFQQKMGKEMCVIDIPLVILMRWNYPMSDRLKCDNIIQIEHYNCSVRGKGQSSNDGMSEGLKESEGKWKGVLDKIVSDVKGQFQNDIVSFVHFMHTQLQNFANVEQ